MTTTSVNMERPARDRAAHAETAGPWQGMYAGGLVALAYGALELSLFGPFTRGAGQSIGSWYGGTMFVYLLVYAALGATAGVVAGFALGRLGRARHHAMPALSALLMLAFVGNAWVSGYPPGESPFLAGLLPLAMWLLVGLLFTQEDRTRTFLGSPWAAAVLTLAPFSVAQGDVVHLGRVPDFTAAAVIAGLVLGLARLCRSFPFGRWLPSARVQAAFTLSVLLVSFAALRLISARPVAAMQETGASRRPSIVLITLDTTRADHLSVYGYPRRTTPRLERFASGATLYRHAYANGDMTLASHGAIFTGLYPTENGAHVDHAVRSAVSPTIPTLGQLLHDAGYRTYASVANIVFLDPAWGFARGFDRWQLPRPLPVVSPNQYRYLLRMGVYKLTLPWLWTEALRLYAPANEVADAGERLPGDADGKPFFLFMNFMESHRPWVPRGPFRTMFPGYDQSFDEMSIRRVQPDVIAGRRTLTANEISKLHAAHDGSVAYLDDIVGGMLERFRQEPWYDESLIVVTADHGELLGDKNMLDHGDGVDQGLTSIPMIVKFPGQTAAREVRSPVSQVDLFPTILAAAGVSLPGIRPGMDLGAGDPHDDRAIVIESFPSRTQIAVAPAKMDRMERAIVQGRWKLIVSSNGRRELYDMENDPSESHNVAALRPDVAVPLETQLAAWAAEAEEHRPPPTVPPDRSQD